MRDPACRRDTLLPESLDTAYGLLRSAYLGFAWHLLQSAASWQQAEAALYLFRRAVQGGRGGPRWRGEQPAPSWRLESAPSPLVCISMEAQPPPRLCHPSSSSAARPPARPPARPQRGQPQREDAGAGGPRGGRRRKRSAGRRRRRRRRGCTTGAAAAGVPLRPALLRGGDGPHGGVAPAAGARCLRAARRVRGLVWPRRGGPAPRRLPPLPGRHASWRGEQARRAKPGEAAPFVPACSHAPAPRAMLLQPGRRALLKSPTSGLQ